jgi:hypothetical protein
MIKLSSNLQSLMLKRSNLTDLLNSRGNRAALGGLVGAVGAPLAVRMFKDDMKLKDYLLASLLGAGTGAGATALTDEAIDQIARARAAYERAPHGDAAKAIEDINKKLEGLT